ncbi:MAG: SCO family protein, partial [Bacteroidota bacterium]|nr:SCO family protein [Bacteroidota bacterium]MDX5431307.1 SCO family protein [Bacteroidota bacterium]MDX5470045.1 SCO family protein [Bacteroidota bacterium]
GILAIPIAWIFLLREGQIVSTSLPIYGERYFDTKIGDTVYHAISDFTFIDQEGDSFSQRDLNGKIYVANFFFTNCPDICPSMMSNLQFVYNKYKESPDIRFVSLTVDPARDSVPVLEKYGYHLGAQPKQWYLGTGSKSLLYMAAEYDYLLASVETPIETAFIHSDMAVLVDTHKRIRGFYKATDFNEMRRLSDDIKALVVESNEPEQ